MEEIPAQAGFFTPMSRQYSARAKQNMLATSADEPFLVLLEITHHELEVPVRVVNDSIAITVQGHEFVACPFDITLPDDVEGQVPKAQLSVDNIGRELTQWLEYSRGGKDAKCRIMQVLRSYPDVLEFDMTLDMSGISINNQTVSSELGVQNTFLLPAVTMRYDPFTTPGAF